MRPKMIGCLISAVILSQFAGGCGRSPNALDASTVSAVQILLDDYVGFSHVPGVELTLIDPDGFEWQGSAGVADVRRGSPVDGDHLFRVGSHTKLFVGVVMMKLVEQGLVDLDKPLTTYRPEYEKWSGVTVRMLLDMTSGIPDYLVIPGITMSMLTDPESSMSPKQIVDAVHDEEMMFEPGTEGFYSDTNTFIAALIIEDVTGRPLARNIRRELTLPFGLKDTFLDVNTFRKARLIHGYLDLTVAGNDLTIVDPGLLSLLPMAADLLPQDMLITRTLVDSTYLAHPSYAWAAGALVSTPHDLASFVRSVFSGRVLSPESVSEMTATGTIRMLGYPTDYGIATQSFTHELGTSFGHSGMSYGYRSATFHYPESGWTYSMTCNTYPAPWMEFDTELAAILLDPATSPDASCDVSGNFDLNPAIPEIQAKFRARINTGDGEYVPTGFGTAMLVTGGATESDVTRETMFGRNVFVTTLDDGTVDIRFRGQAFDNPEAFWRDTHILVNPGYLRAISAGGRISTHDVDLYIEDIHGTDDPETYSRRCVVGVVNRIAPSRIGLCDEIDIADEALLRGWISVPVTRKPADIETWLAVSGRPACQCRDAGGNWSACPD